MAPPRLVGLISPSLQLANDSSGVDKATSYFETRRREHFTVDADKSVTLSTSCLGPREFFGNDDASPKIQCEGRRQGRGLSVMHNRAARSHRCTEPSSLSF
jgi:hypothetical protein